MSHPLHTLPDALLHTLGRSGSKNALMQVLTADPAVRPLSWHEVGGPGRAVVAGEGLSIVLRRMSSQTPSEPPVWGVDSFTLQATSTPSSGCWRGPWPDGLPAGESTRSDLDALFGASLFEADGLMFFEMPGPQNDLWGVQCQCDWDGHLQSLTVIWREAWRPLASAAEAQIPPSVRDIAPAALPPAASAPITCGSAGIVPKTGWYEGLLPADHPNYAYLSQAPGRFVRLHEGQRMFTLGVIPAIDEALVVWTWLREK